MRQFALCTFAFAALSLCQNLEGQRSSEERPIMVKIEMPPQSTWTRIVELSVPTVLGAGIALFGVRLNQKHEFEKLNREHSFELKRDLLLKVTESLVETRSALKEMQIAKDYLEFVEANGEEEKDDLKSAEENVRQSWPNYSLHQTELEQSIASASLGVSDDLWVSAQAISASIKEAQRLVAIRSSSSTEAIEKVDREIVNFTQNARKELGIVRISHPGGLTTVAPH